MKKIIIISSLVLYLFASDDYVPLSNLSQEKKVEYNFINKKTEINTAGNNEYEKIENINKNDNIQTFKDEIIEEKQELSKPINNEFVREYKKDNILKDEKKVSQSNFSKDFSITPKLTYSFLKTDIYGTNKVSVLDETNEVIPEISFKYKNHILKADFMDSKAYFNNVLLIGSDLETTTKWNKLYYLYNFKNANLGIAYNKFDLDWKVIKYNVVLSNTEEFPTLEFHMKNEDDKLQVEYGVSYGKNHNIDYVYEYYVNLGYKLLNNDALILSAGYKNRTLDFEDDINGYKFQYKGPILTLGATF
ncbi:hypothetical protein [Arcobacter defluvii]|uniref:Uncharacterized protein n=1 Tax=Arcobacter defluvii TaxID=873191 RepID=A0AAE7BG85_9BACT|nr:hypothetical protein [Arcobacter defluvii]QKF77249.1 hypothetical protein ADFLV_1216 [Arcobacter defluvii]RXI33462.1 hypothetical protein CP964_05580 [Arcobacter defluvii]